MVLARPEPEPPAAVTSSVAVVKGGGGPAASGPVRAGLVRPPGGRQPQRRRLDPPGAQAGAQRRGEPRAQAVADEPIEHPPRQLRLGARPVERPPVRPGRGPAASGVSSRSSTLTTRGEPPGGAQLRRQLPGDPLPLPVGIGGQQHALRAPRRALQLAERARPAPDQLPGRLEAVGRDRSPPGSAGGRGGGRRWPARSQPGPSQRRRVSALAGDSTTRSAVGAARSAIAPPRRRAGRSAGPDAARRARPAPAPAARPAPPPRSAPPPGPPRRGGAATP